MLTDRIRDILVDKNLSPSQFADEIGVPRSSISHLLSGRNRPSLELVRRTVRRFPDLGLDWIMEEDEAPPVPAPPPLPAPPVSAPAAASDPYDPSAAATTPRRIARVLVFYDDHTFAEFRPSES